MLRGSSSEAELNLDLSSVAANEYCTPLNSPTITRTMADDAAIIAANDGQTSGALGIDEGRPRTDSGRSDCGDLFDGRVVQAPHAYEIITKDTRSAVFQPADFEVIVHACHAAAVIK